MFKSADNLFLTFTSFGYHWRAGDEQFSARYGNKADSKIIWTLKIITFFKLRSLILLLNHFDTYLRKTDTDLTDYRKVIFRTNISSIHLKILSWAVEIHVLIQCIGVCTQEHIYFRLYNDMVSSKCPFENL